MDRRVLLKEGQRHYRQRERKSAPVCLKARSSGIAGDKERLSDTRSTALEECSFEGCLGFTLHRRDSNHCLSRKWTSSPSSLLEQAFEILTSGNHQGFTVDSPQAPQAKTSHSMPLFAFSEQWFDPDLTLAHGFQGGEGLLIAFDAFHRVGKKGAMDVPTARALGTLAFHWTDIADRRIRTVVGLLGPFHSGRWSQDLALGTAN